MGPAEVIAFEGTPADRPGPTRASERASQPVPDIRPRAGNELSRFTSRSRSMFSTRSAGCHSRVPDPVARVVPMSAERTHVGTRGGFVNGRFSQRSASGAGSTASAWTIPMKGFQDLVGVGKQDRYVPVTSSFGASYVGQLLRRTVGSCVNVLSAEKCC